MGYTSFVVLVVCICIKPALFWSIDSCHIYFIVCKKCARVRCMSDERFAPRDFCENLTPALAHAHRVFKLRRKFPILRHHRPPVSQHPRLRHAFVRHWFDGEEHPRLEQRALSWVSTAVLNVRRRVEPSPYAVRRVFVHLEVRLWGHQQHQRCHHRHHRGNVMSTTSISYPFHSCLFLYHLYMTFCVKVFSLRLRRMDMERRRMYICMSLTTE